MSYRRELRDQALGAPERRRQRHEAAIELLTQTGDAIAGIAERLGYGDTANFRRAFRRWTGQSPAAFRERHQRDKAQDVLSKQSAE